MDDWFDLILDSYLPVFLLSSLFFTPAHNLSAI